MALGYQWVARWPRAALQTHLLIRELRVEGLGIQLHPPDLLQPLAEPSQARKLGVKDLLELQKGGDLSMCRQGGHTHQGSLAGTQTPCVSAAG